MRRGLASNCEDCYPLHVSKQAGAYSRDEEQDVFKRRAADLPIP